MGKAKKIQTVAESFHNLCQQYERLGQFLRACSEANQQKNYEMTTAAGQSVVQQYYEMGEQLKIVGEGIDKLGGPKLFTSSLN